jgi:hypothetical protein
MPDLILAIDLVRTAEYGLRDLMRRALEQQRYRDLGEVAPLADTLADLVRRAESGADAFAVVASGRPITASAPAPRAVPAKAPSRVNARDEYPRFERDGDKLVKIAWSKKDKREYEHRAPHDAVLRVTERLALDVRPGTAFSMDKLMPFKDNEGNDIPSYQAYLALAWFRDLGSVEQRGKDGYAVKDGELSVERVEQAWNVLHSRK